MEGLYKYSHRLRCKSSSGIQQNRPKNSTHGNCIVCGRFMEELNEDKRCRTPECNRLLEKICIERGVGMQATDGFDTWIVFKPASVLTEAEHWNAEQDTHQLDHNTCKCGRGLKLPRADVCAQCYREGNVAKMYDRKRRRNKRKGKISSKIKGLDKIKLK